MSAAADTTKTNPSDVPTVRLDTERVTHELAARLATSFLAHVLFLKNQIPFPIAQLARMPDTETRSRATKKRQQLLGSFDTLASHLYTTFVTLSTSLALRHTRVGTDEISGRRDVGSVFLAIVLGPTIGTAKSRVIMGIDGFDIKVWGLRDDATRPSMSTKTAECSHVDNDDLSEESGSHDSKEDVGTDDSIESLRETDEESTANQSSSEDGEEDSSDDEPPPPSRSPSPSPTSSPPPQPLAPAPEHVALPPRLEESDDTVLRAAERLLSFTLARACAEDIHGQGIAAELPPTNVHVLIRAPRRFTHPAWIPRQSFSPALEVFLNAFLDMSADSRRSKTPTTTSGRQTHRQGNFRVEGIWARACRPGSGHQSTKPDGVKGIETGLESGTDGEDVDEDIDEQDELIWWSWDGKLTGFTDW
ncbi:hypothetical protein EDD16DRAFT_1746693 [Pisolithus croceorrhizus]|nr:hypothetical protein EDD16DRAFT_1746693 [Pisolithus croceorrhizus]KAI6117461.1 hypothetical protein EV401DRAFT_1863674 [Pisolithus croceorrhizus]